MEIILAVNSTDILLCSKMTFLMFPEDKKERVYSSVYAFTKKFSV